MNDSNFARSRTLFLLPFSDVRRFAMLGLAAMALTLSACGIDTAQESLIEALADVEGLDVDIDDDTLVYSVEGEDGFNAVVGSGASVPSGFPDDVLVYEGAEITLSMETEEGFQLMLLAQATPEGVWRAYQTALVVEGWRSADSMVTRALAVATYKKGSRVVSVSVSSVADGDASQITLATGTG